jgi:hypothetical protein
MDASGQIRALVVLSVEQLNKLLSSKKNLYGLSPQANYTDRPPLVGEVIANFCG